MRKMVKGFTFTDLLSNGGRWKITVHANTFKKISHNHTGHKEHSGGSGLRMTGWEEDALDRVGTEDLSQELTLRNGQW